MSSFDTTLTNLGIGRTTSATPVAAKATNLGQADFLKLMTAQLNNQDPFAPVDNTQMVAQMAQFSSLAGITDMNTTLKSISDKLGGTTTSDAVSYVGRNVLTPGSTAYARSTGGITGAAEIDADATDVTVSIEGADGQTLKTISLGPQKKGSVTFDWNGTTDQGQSAGNGPFTVKVGAQNSGSTIASRALVWAPVESVSLPSSGTPLLTVTGVGQVPVSAVRQIG